MSDLICVTNRTLCKENFLDRIEKIAAQHPKAVLLREKDLAPSEYARLARKVLAICARHHTLCILHNFIEIAEQEKAFAIHLPLPILRRMTKGQKHVFSVIGASCHSPEEAAEAEALGCTYITAGHIFATDCKKDLPGRGLDFLSKVCDSCRIPVYAIGGIHKDNISAVRSAGAKGACVMSGIMECKDVSAYFKILSNNLTQDFAPAAKSVKMRKG